MKIKLYDGQLEMSFASARGCASVRQRRLSRAQWWFQRMRQVVDGAMDWHPMPAPRPEQTWLPGTHRELETAPPAPATERLAA
jgi:hypothetical protein